MPAMGAPVTVTNWPDGSSPGGGGAQQDTLEAVATAIGNTDDAAWNGTDPNATVIALLKAIAANTATT